jgi:hypothetical protein
VGLPAKPELHDRGQARRGSHVSPGRPGEWGLRSLDALRRGLRSRPARNYGRGRHGAPRAGHDDLPVRRSRHVHGRRLRRAKRPRLRLRSEDRPLLRAERPRYLDGHRSLGTGKDLWSAYARENSDGSVDVFYDRYGCRSNVGDIYRIRDQAPCQVEGVFISAAGWGRALDMESSSQKFNHRKRRHEPNGPARGLRPCIPY